MFHKTSSWKQIWRVISTFTAVLAVLLASVIPANAAATRTVVPVDSGVALLQPTQAQKMEAMKRLEQSRSADPTGFAKRLGIIQSSKTLTTFLASDIRFDSQLQQEFLAAMMPTDVLESLVVLTETGYLTLAVKDGPSGSKVAKIHKSKPAMMGGGLRGMSMRPMFPQCPAAWAALWAWWGTNAAFCGAMGFFGPMAALGCSAAMAIAGSVIDFNRGC